MKYLPILPFLFSIGLFSQTQVGSDIFGESNEDFSGYSVSLSGDGSILAVGAPYNNGNGQDSGHVRVFENINGDWTQIGADIDGAAAGDIGYITSLSNDGNILAISSVRNSGNGTWSGHVRVFENVNSNWAQIGADIEGDAAQDQFGGGLDISGNGQILAIGAENNDANGTDSGHVRVFENINSNWIQIGADIEGNPGDRLGHVSISDDGTILAVGATKSDVNGNSSGHVSVLENINGSWIQIGNDINGDNPFDFFGYQLSISKNGRTLAIGAPNSSTIAFLSGYVKIYENNNGTWSQKGDTIFGDTDDFFGGTIDISDNGNVIVIGATGNSFVRVYQFTGNGWIQRGNDISGNKTEDIFGIVSLSSQGNYLAIGAPGNDENGEDSGQVKVFDLSEVLSINEIFSENLITLYPNPSSNTVHIQLKKNNNLIEIVIYNALGKKVYNTTSEMIDVSNFRTGLYILKISTFHGIGHKKLIIN